MARGRRSVPIDVEARMGRLLDAFVIDVRRAVGEVVIPEVARALSDTSSRVESEVLAPPSSPSRFAVEPRALDARLQRVVEKHQLSEREAAILAASAHGVPRPRLSETLGTSENTIKTQVRSLLRKLRMPDLDDAVWAIRGASMGGEASPLRRRRRRTRTR